MSSTTLTTWVSITGLVTALMVILVAINKFLRRVDLLNSLPRAVDEQSKRIDALERTVHAHTTEHHTASDHRRRRRD